MEDETVDVTLHVYDLSGGMARMMSAAILGKHIDGIWHTGVVVYGQEYFFGGSGIQSCPPGGTLLGQPQSVLRVGCTQIPYGIFVDYLAALAESEYRGDKYDLLRHNCNSFSNEVSNFLCGTGIPQHIVDLPGQVLDTPLGQSLLPLLNSLSAPNVNVRRIGAAAVGRDYSASSPRDRRQPSPEAVQLAKDIEDARRDSLKLEEKRNSILDKVDKLDKKKNKKKKHHHRSPSVPPLNDPARADMADNLAAAAVQSLEDQDEQPRPPREPPVVYKDAVDLKKEFGVLTACLERVGDEFDQQSLSELRQYVIDDEGSWALGDNFLTFIGKWLNDDQPSNEELRVKLLLVLAAAALKEDCILLLHQDRREHVIMNYAHNVDRLPLAEQEPLVLLMCNLFENSSSSEWLLYISEWSAPHTTLPLSNIRVTTKVAVTALLSESSTLQEWGTAIIYNLAIKEKMERTRTFSDLMPRGSLSKVFDDVATELAMAILQFFSGDHSEEHIYRCMKGLLRFAYIAHSEVPALIKMIGPDPSQFKGMSARIDELIAPLSDRLRSVRGMD